MKRRLNIILIATIVMTSLLFTGCTTQNRNVNELVEKAAIKELIDTFSNLADVKDAASQGDLFLEDGKLEFQVGFDGEINNIEGRQALVEAFKNTIEPCKAVYHINGQSNVTFTNDSLTEADGIAYCTATLVNEVNGKDIGTMNFVRYSDKYTKQNGKWYIKLRRTTFITSDTFEMNTAQLPTNNAASSSASESLTSTSNFDLVNKVVKLNSGYNMPTSGIGVFGIEPKDAERAVEYSLRNGNRLIDTANAYMNEKAVGRAIKNSGVDRSEIFLTSKLWVSEYGRAKEAIDETLDRLGVEYVDLLLLHQPYGTIVEAWFPLAGRGHTEILLDNDIIKDIANAHGKSPAQIVLRWHLQHGDIAIPGSKTESHILENINIYDFELSDEEMDRIKTINTNSSQYSYAGGADEEEMGKRYENATFDFNSQE